MINFPDPEMELLFRCVRVEAPEAFDARVVELLRGGLNWERLLKLSMGQGVMPLVYRRLNERFSAEMPEGELERLRGHYHANGARNAYLTGELLRILKILERDGIVALPYKGPALSVDAYGDLTLRRFSDLDVLIRRNDLGRVTTLLAREGYECEFELGGERERLFTKFWYVQPFTNPRTGVYVEVHWKVAPFFFSFDLDVEELWENTRPVVLAGREVKAPSVQDTLLLLCVHGAKDHWSKLEWICALDGFVRRNRGLDWDYALRRARGLGSERMLLLGMFLANFVCGIELPQPVSARVNGSRVVRSLARRVLTQLATRQKGLSSFFGRTTFHLGARERLSDRAKYCARVATTTSPSEWDLFRLPPDLFFVYSLVRPLRRAKQAVLNVTKGQSAGKGSP